MAEPNEQETQPDAPQPMVTPAAETSATPRAPANGPPPASLGRLDLFLLALLLLFAFLLGSFAASNSDIWLHLASGRRIAQGEWTIGVDPFSFATEASSSHPAVRWVEHSWLYSLLLYLLYNLVGGPGLVLLKALAVLALAWCLLRIPGDKRSRLISVIYVGLALLAVSPHLLLRPMTVSFLLFGISLLICYRAGALGNVTPKPRLLWWLPLVFCLWANVDAWFILGPLTLVLLWLGVGLGYLLGIRGTFPGKTLGAVLGVGLLACLLNPNHVRVFMLPPELANVILHVVNIPDFLGAGGRALQPAEPDTFVLVSPLSQRYWGNPLPGGGQNIAGLAYLCLLILGVISFVANSAVTKKPGAPGLHPGRFALWIGLAFLSLLQIRLIPWFAIVSAPITLLNLLDWRTWLTNIQVPSWRPALLGRLLVLLIALVLLFLAWPGWIYAPFGDFGSPRRVAWDVPINPSAHAAAVYLAAQKDGKPELRVFNFSTEIAHYCAWFAPGVKCFLDSRWSLFADEAAEYARARRALLANLAEVWQNTLLDHKIDLVVLGNYENERQAELVTRFWLDPLHWLQKYTDGRTVVLAWSGPGKTFDDTFAAEVKRRGFGAVPDDQRSPIKAPTWPQEEPPFWSEYAEGLPPLPLAADEAVLWLRYHQTRATNWAGPFMAAWQVVCWAEPAGLGSLSATLPFTLHAMFKIPENIYAKLRYRSNNKFLLKARDLGPPEAMLLAIRCIRRALALDPDYPRNYAILADTCKELNHQEEHWSNYEGDRRRAGGLRADIRQVQVVTALKTYLDLRPDDAQVHQQLGAIFLQLNFLDSGLEHLQQVVRGFDRYRPKTTDPKMLAAIKKQREGLEKEVQSIEAEVKKRHEQYALEAASKKSLEKFGLAMSKGLAKEAVEQLATIKLEGLSQAEKLEAEQRLTQMLLLLGRASELHDDMIDPSSAHFRVLHAAALGNYGALDQVLAEMIQSVARERTRVLPGALADHLQVFAGPELASLFPTALRAGLLGYLARLQTNIRASIQKEAELRTLRGIMALEWGATAAACAHFAAALAVAGTTTYFPDRPIAERYVQLMR